MSVAGLKPLRDKVLVRPDALASHATASRIVVQARTGIYTSREQLGRTGTVLAVGTCRMRWEDRIGKHAQRYRTQPPDVKVGERVLFGEFDYPKIGDDLVISEADIVGVIE